MTHVFDANSSTLYACLLRRILYFNASSVSSPYCGDGLVQALDLEAGGGRIGRAGRRTMLELGCGVGNAVFPLLEDNRGLYVIAVDLSTRAIDILKQHPMYR